jgi:predicted small lipoprotein YifL
MRIPHATALLLVLACLLAPAACGKKGAPMPQRPEDRFSFEKIESSSTNDCVSASFEVQGASRYLSRLVLLVEDPERSCQDCPFRPDRRIELSLSDDQVKMYPDSLSVTYCGLGFTKPPRFRVGGVHAMLGMPLVLTPVLP